ncbi:MAG: hypothetical protein ABIE25_03565 [Thermoplasmatota archaeon]|nr:hypothetical protein [Candidatus Thermoplasmatota archaeon]MBU1914276.1 hypothetical protein [Candidatus Thermoplasmatota archaeon]
MTDEDHNRLTVLEHKVQGLREILSVVTIVAFTVFLGIPIVSSVVGVGTYSEFFGAAWNTTLLYGLLVANTVGYLWSEL